MLCSGRRWTSPAQRLNSTKMSGVALIVTPPASARSDSPVPQRLRGHVQRHQRRGARGVHRYRGAFQPEHVGDPAGRDAGQLAGQPEALHGLAPSTCRSPAASDPANTPVALPRNVVGSIPARSNASQVSSRNMPLLGIHRQRFGRADAEERRIEISDVFDEAADAGVAGARRRRGRGCTDWPRPSRGHRGTR